MVETLEESEQALPETEIADPYPDPTAYPSACHWPRSISEAYRRGHGPYTILNADFLLEEEPLELYNGWLVWPEMTDVPERRVAGTMQEILSIAARAAGFGQAYPDQVECEMVTGDLVKPDVCLISNERYDQKVGPANPDKPAQHRILDGGPELAIELRSPSNTRKDEAEKRDKYFRSGTLVVWDVEPYQHIIWVYEVENPSVGVEYKGQEEISCEQLLPGWRWVVEDFFNPQLSAEQVVGKVAQQWRAESEAKGRTEGEAQGELNMLRRTVVRQAGRRFGTEKLPTDLEVRLGGYKAEQLEALLDSVSDSATLEEWLASFPQA